MNQTIARILMLWWIVGLMSAISLPAVFDASGFSSPSTGQTWPVLMFSKFPQEHGGFFYYVTISQCVWYWSATCVFWVSAIIFLIGILMQYAARRSWWDFGQILVSAMMDSRNTSRAALGFAVFGVWAQYAVAAESTASRPSSSQAEHVAEITQREPASSADAPHIDWLTLREERVGGGVFIIEKVGYHSPKGNANKLHLQLISVSRPDVRPAIRDHAIHAPAPRQQRGTFLVARFDCGHFDKSYSHVERAVVMDAGGERSNAVEFTVDCDLAFTS